MKPIQIKATVMTKTLFAAVALIALIGCASAGVISVTFNKPDDVSGVVGYQVEDAKNGTIYLSVGGVDSTNLTLPSPYSSTLQVRSVGADGAVSEPSNVITNTVLSKPQNLKKR